MMPTLAAEAIRPATVRPVEGLSASRAAGIATALSILGLTHLWSTVAFLWALWTTDALKSIGMAIPVVSLILILRVWRRQGWQMQGSWWGLAIILATIAAVRIRDQAILVFMFSPQWSVYVPPHSLVVFAYASGVVLLFGGTLLYRAALFPILLLWFVNPIPHVFNVLVDLPLQRASAHVARSFAIALGQPLSPDQLRLMFTPEFGMFIAPGCNGIRGAVTMGFIALIAGYIYRFRWRAHALVVVASILLGYVFNFVRLCVLVLYYLVALKFPWLQDRAEMGDYIIGALLFLFATWLLFGMIRILRTHPSQLHPEQPDTAPSPLASTPRASLYTRLTLMAAIALVGSATLARALHRARPTSPEALALAADSKALGRFPAQVGPYTLARTWNENMVAGPLVFHWAQYTPADGGTPISLGVSPVLGSHDTLICHSARGEDPLWHGQLDLPTAAGSPTGFSVAFFNDGATQYLEATTLCTGSTCGEYSTDRTRFGFVYSRPAPQALLTQDPQRPIPILIRAETIDTTLPPDVARRNLTASITAFLASTSLDELTRPYRRP